jgi:hypothetical protein
MEPFCAELKNAHLKNEPLKGLPPMLTKRIYSNYNDIQNTTVDDKISPRIIFQYPACTILASQRQAGRQRCSLQS